MKGDFMLGIFKRDPVKKLEAEYQKVAQQAMEAQQNGNIELYSKLSQKAEEIGLEIDRLKDKN